MQVLLIGCFKGLVTSQTHLHHNLIDGGGAQQIPSLSNLLILFSFIGEVWMVSIRSIEALLYWGSSNLDLVGGSWKPKYKINVKKERTSGHGSIFVLCAHMDHYDNFRASFLPCDFAKYDWDLLLTCFITDLSSSMNMDRWWMAECEVYNTSIVLMCLGTNIWHLEEKWLYLSF